MIKRALYLASCIIAGCGTSENGTGGGGATSTSTTASVSTSTTTITSDASSGTATCNGAGPCVECVDASECPAAAACRVPLCTGAGQCEEALAPVGTACAQGICNGIGNCVGCLEDGACPDDACSEGRCDVNQECVRDEVPIGGTCLTDPGLVCNGDGACVLCVDDTQCPATSLDCKINACSADGMSCALADAPNGAPCIHGGEVCLWGQCRDCATSADCPSSDCKVGSCTSTGLCTMVSIPAGQPCANTPGGICDGAGHCDPCGLSCPVAGECQTLVCDQGTCATSGLPAGTPCSTGTCDGDGACSVCDEDADCGDPHQPDVSYNGSCQYRACVGGVCLWQPVNDGVRCDFSGDPVFCYQGTCSGCAVCPFGCCGLPDFRCMNADGTGC